MSQGTPQRRVWIWLLAALAFIVVLLLMGRFSYDLGSDQTTTLLHTTATALQATAVVIQQRLQDTAVAVQVKDTVTAQAPLRLTEVATHVQATQVRREATRASLEGNQLATQAALEEIRGQQLYATESAFGTAVVAQSHREQVAAVALAVQQTVVALPTSTLLPTSTPSKPRINLLMTGCDTSFAGSRGETTRVYVVADNVGNVDVSGIVVVAKASDEERPHPDGFKQVQYLPVSHTVSLQLTVDTQAFHQSAVTVFLYTKEGAHEATYRNECPEIDPKLLKEINQVVGIVGPRGRFGKLLAASTLLLP